MKFRSTRNANFSDISASIETTNTKVLNAFVWFCEHIVLNSDKINNPKDNYDAVLMMTDKQFSLSDGEYYLFKEILDTMSTNKYKKIALDGQVFYVYWGVYNTAPLFEIE